MASQIVVEMDANEARLWSAFQKVASGTVEMETGMKKVSRATNEAAKEQRELERSAKRVLDSIATPQERFNQRLQELGRLYSANKLTVEQFRTALTKVRTEYDALTATVADNSKEQAELERAAKKVIDSIATPQDRYNQKVAELNRLYGAGKLTVEQFRTAMTKVRGEYELLNTTVDANAAKIQQSADAGIRAFGPQIVSQVRGLIGALGITGGLAGALQLINKEYDAIKERQAASARESMTVADAEINALRNLGPTTAAERDEFLTAIQQMSRETGVSRKDLYLRAASALSAKGALPTETALQAVELSAQLVPEDAEEGEAVAGSMLDIMKLTGSKDPNAALGLLARVGEQSRIKSTGYLAKNVAPGLVTDILRGDKPEEAAALFSTISQAIVDTTGEKSRVIMSKLADQLEEALPEEKTGLKSTRERIEAIQKDPKLQKRLIPELKLGATGGGPLEVLLKGEGQTTETYRQFLADATTMEENAEYITNQIDLIRGTELQRTAQFGRTVKTAAEELAVADQPGARIGLVREQFVPLLKQVGMGDMATKLEELSVRASGDELEDFMESLADQERRLRMRGGEAWRRQEVERVGEEKVLARERTREAQADILQALREMYEQINASDPKMDENNDLLKEISTKLDGNRQPRPMPAASASANAANRE